VTVGAGALVSAVPGASAECSVAVDCGEPGSIALEVEDVCMPLVDVLLGEPASEQPLTTTTKSASA
jgi:hypothetical protein